MTRLATPAHSADQPSPRALALPVPLRTLSGTFLSRLHSPDPVARRSLRVWLLVLTIIALSLGDLWMTLTYLTSVGMGEANPVARLVMAYNSPNLLAAWKCASVALACLIFVFARKRLSSEIACWCCVGVLALLTVRWAQYATESAKLTPVLHAAHQYDGGQWVQMTAD